MSGRRGAQSDDEKVVLTVGVTSNSFDTLNPLVGYTVLDYDVWIPQYDTVTRKAAADFETIPGLAESWEGSNDGKTYTYKLRDGLEWSGWRTAHGEGRRLHHQPLARGSTGRTTRTPRT